MSVKEVAEAIYRLQREDEKVQSPGECRYAAGKMMSVAQKADISPPHAKTEYLVWPEAEAGVEKIHYAIRVSDGTEVKTFNPSPAAGFPQYNGNSELAPGLIPQMKVTERVL